MIDVSPISSNEVKTWLLHRHYAKRACPVSYAFGAYRGSTLIGIVTYGVPVASTLRRGVCGERWQEKVLELNRLCCENASNIASQIIGQSLRQLPRPSIVVSFADTAQGHIGFVYQAANFLYTGLSAKRTDWKIKGMEHLHGATVADKSRGLKHRAAWMRQEYGDAFYLKQRPRKHRYVFFCGNKREKRAMREALNYPVLAYPKGDSRHYDASGVVQLQERLVF